MCIQIVCVRVYVCVQAVSAENKLVLFACGGGGGGGVCMYSVCVYF